MSNFFVDTSALGRRYLLEVGSTWVRSWIEKVAGNVIIVSDLASVEMCTTFQRLKRESILTAPQTTYLVNSLIAHMRNEYLTIPLDAPTLGLARTVAAQFPLRALDAVQLACAMRAVTWLGEPCTFVSGDNRLLVAAMAEGFVTDNPYLHP